MLRKFIGIGFALILLIGAGRSLDLGISPTTASWSPMQIAMACIMTILGIGILFIVLKLFHTLIKKFVLPFFISSIIFGYITAGTILDGKSPSSAGVLLALLAVFVAIIAYTSRLLYQGGLSGLFGGLSGRWNVSDRAGTGRYDDHASYAPRRPAFDFKSVNGMSALKAQLLEAVKDNKAAGKKRV